MRWFGHVRRKDDGHIVRRMLMMELSGKRKGRRPKSRFVDAVRKGIAVVEITEEDAEARNKPRWKIRCASPNVRSRNKKYLNYGLPDHQRYPFDGHGL